MKTKYDSYDNFIIVSVISDAGNILYASCFISLSGEGSMRLISGYDLHNYSLNPAKFAVFCRSMVNSSLSFLKSRVSNLVEPDPELDFELI